MDIVKENWIIASASQQRGKLYIEFKNGQNLTICKSLKLAPQVGESVEVRKISRFPISAHLKQGNDKIELFAFSPKNYPKGLKELLAQEKEATA